MKDKQNRFVMIMPCYNAEKTIAQSLLSIISQSYSNWKILIRDDMSTDNTRQIIDNFINVFGLQEKIFVESNKEKKWEVRNILELLCKCEDDDIVCRIERRDISIRRCIISKK
jgi:glycosyltransferase involved in cell wall biosynthesis